jgi:8-oxo-dGTP pyrophosphatase MutT (NUDIX family)
MVRIEAITEPITIKIDRSPKVHSQAGAVDAAWQGLCAQNPRYFNGQMLAFDSYDPATGVIHASVEEYKYHAVRDTVDAGISLLAVTAILVCIDSEQSDAMYLIGKRSPKLHRYGGLWELGPSGGVDVPRTDDMLDQDQIIAEAAREVREEVDLQLFDIPAKFAALVHDHGVGSTDIAIELAIGPIPSLQHNWEYSEIKWVSKHELGKWIQNNPVDFIPTTVALIEFLEQSAG